MKEFLVLPKKLLEIWVEDPGSGKNLPDPGSKKHRIPDPQDWMNGPRQP